MKRLIFFAVLLLSPGIVHAENYGGVPDRFFNLIKQGKTDEAVDLFVNTNKWAGKNSDQIVQLRTQLPKLNALVGKYLFYELISETAVGTHYVHQIYLVGYERQPVRFELELYKPSGEWRLQGVSFDAKLTDDIEKQANQRIVK